jgi:hypothetical protein
MRKKRLPVASEVSQCTAAGGDVQAVDGADAAVAATLYDAGGKQKP